jgi:hypothetical protein
MAEIGAQSMSLTPLSGGTIYWNRTVELVGELCLPTRDAAWRVARK